MTEIMTVGDLRARRPRLANQSAKYAVPFNRGLRPIPRACRRTLYRRTHEEASGGTRLGSWTSLRNGSVRTYAGHGVLGHFAKSKVLASERRGWHRIRRERNVVQLRKQVCSATCTGHFCIVLHDRCAAGSLLDRGISSRAHLPSTCCFGEMVVRLLTENTF